MKIGDKEFTAKFDNLIMWNIEKDFDNKSITKIMSDIDSLTMKEMGLLIYNTISDEISWEDFGKTIKINQYVAAATEVGKVIAEAFDTGGKKN